MFNIALIKRVTLFTLFFFTTFVLISNFASAQNENVFAEVEKYMQEGDYDKGEGILVGYINGIQSIKGHESNLAKAYYLLAKTYYLVKESDEKIGETIRMVFKVYPNFTQQEEDLYFKERVEKIRKSFPTTIEVPQPLPIKDTTHKTGVFEKTKTVKKKKKRKFPFLLVFGGLAVLTVLIVLLAKKKKEEPKTGTITSATVKFTITFAGENMQTKHKVYVDGNEKINQFFKFTKHYNENHDWDDFQHITKSLTIKKGLGQFTIKHEVGPNWSKFYPKEGTWNGSPSYKLEVTDYTFENGLDPGRPKLSEYSFTLLVSPWHDDPAHEWYRIKTKSITISSALSTSVQAKTKWSQEKPKAISDKGKELR